MPEGEFGFQRERVHTVLNICQMVLKDQRRGNDGPDSLLTRTTEVWIPLASISTTTPRQDPSDRLRDGGIRGPLCFSSNTGYIFFFSAFQSDLFNWPLEDGWLRLAC